MSNLRYHILLPLYVKSYLQKSKTINMLNFHMSESSKLRVHLYSMVTQNRNVMSGEYKIVDNVSQVDGEEELLLVKKNYDVYISKILTDKKKLFVKIAEFSSLSFAFKM